ncbi:MAG: hypothetical protein WCK35_13805 [Chloroflexota bacterium]
MGIEAISSIKAVDLSSLAQTQATTASTTAAKSSQTSTQKTQGTPPAPAGGTGKAAASSTSSTSTAKIYEAADTNKDGVVSFQEELLYSISHPTDETEKMAETSSSQLQSGLKSYKEQNQETSTSSTTLPLTEI